VPAASDPRVGAPDHVAAAGKPSQSYQRKTPQQRLLINQALDILHAFGVPLDATPRRLERMAGAFLAAADVRKPGDWSTAKDTNSGWGPKTRDMIAWENKHLGENISMGSYDDIRRKDLKLPVLAGIVARTKEGSARNDSTRGYVLEPEHAKLIRRYGKPRWRREVDAFMADRPRLEDLLARRRDLELITVKVPGGDELAFSPGEHNELQKAVIEEFLPRYGHGAELLYVGDTANKFLILDENRLTALNFFELAHGELPDVVAYSRKKNWLYLIEAVHTSGPISETRLLELQELTRECTADIVYVTAFLTRNKFRQWMREIAWETEVWIAETPDHLIHFNGDKFLGPY